MIHRQNLQFPTKETALREDVHALGGLIGDVLRDQGGDRLFERVEGDRVAAIARRDGDAGSAVELTARTAGRDATGIKPGIAGNQSLEVVRRYEIQAVLAYEVAQEVCVLLHHESRKVELALRYELSLLGQCMCPTEL